MSFLKKFYFLFFIILIAIFGSLISWYTYKNAKDETVESLIARTDTISQLIEELDLSSLSFSAKDLENPLYQKLKRHFMNARSVNDDVRFIYIFVKDEGVVKFVIDSEPEDSEDYSPPGQVYEEAEEQGEIKHVFNTGESVVQPAYSDRWGTWITGLSAIKNPNGGTPKYVVGIDINAQDFIMGPYLKAAFPATLSLLLIILATSVYHIRKKEIELVETKAQFVSVASHELRSPLTGIRWSSENLLSDPTISENSKKIIKGIQSSSVHLLSVINDLLSISIAKHDFVNRKTFTSVDIHNLIKAILADLSSTAMSNKIEVKHDVFDEGMYVNGSEDRLKNLFSNLLSNAIKYSRPESSVLVNVGLHTVFNKKFVRVVIRDNGIGIPKDALQKVIRGFYRAKNAKNHTEHGTGLGLYICFKIAEIHDGTITIDSIEDKGTMVTVSLPFFDM